MGRAILLARSLEIFPLRKAIALLAVTLTYTAGVGAAATKKKSTHHKSPAPTHKSSKLNKSKKPAGSHHSKSSRTARRAPTSTWRAGQMEPTPDRYKEIQEALAQRGYLHEEATGKWDQESGDALRRFQQDQSIEPSGKLDSLSLIALGLGPKHDASAASPRATPQP